jgi:hypothetical protein
MKRRQSELVWLRDLIDQLSSCRQQLEWSQDSQATQYLTETMLRDLDSARRVCISLRRHSAAVAVN